MARTFSEDLQHAAAAHPSRAAVITPAGEFTYAELDRAADRIAAGLRARGIGPGDRVALQLPNGSSAVAGIYGALRAGAAFVPMSPSLKAAKLRELLDHCDASVLVSDPQQIAELEREPGSAPAAMGAADLAALIYTSGSTGEPKGVTLTHRNMTFVADSMIEYLELDSRDRVLCVLPLSFGYGLYQLLTSVRIGATLVLESGFSFPGRVVQLLGEQRITAFAGVPTVFAVLLSLRGLKDRRFPHLRLITSAGAALPTATVTALSEALPDTRLYSMYGQTECQRVCYLPPEQVGTRPGSVGIAIPGTEAWVDDGAGSPAAPGVVGELMVRGEHVMQGYWKDPRATAQRLRPGRWPWDRVLATGDLFRTDEQGYLYFVARRDDIIKSGGEKVAPREVEEALLSAEGVREAVVIGASDRVLGEAVHAHVAPQPGRQLDAATLRRHCAARLEDHKVPRVIVVRDELPRTYNGKIDRRALHAPSPRRRRAPVTRRAVR